VLDRARLTGTACEGAAAGRKGAPSDNNAVSGSAHYVRYTEARRLAAAGPVHGLAGSSGAGQVRSVQRRAGNLGTLDAITRLCLSVQAVGGSPPVPPAAPWNV